VKSPLSVVQTLAAESARIRDAFFLENGQKIVDAASVISSAFRRGQKLLLFGNGGSAADAQHIAAEFVGRFIPGTPGTSSDFSRHGYLRAHRTGQRLRLQRGLLATDRSAWSFW
jgi:hypothetical protein